MLTLLLFRHAKAERGGAGLSDETRPLTSRGRDDAASVGRRLAVEGYMPDLVLCSPATRALETLALASPYWAPAPRVAITAALYRMMQGNYLDAIRAAPAASRLMLVAHNSAMEETARSLAGAGDDAARAELAAGFPTAAIAVLEFDLPGWAGIDVGRGTLRALLKPH